MTEINSSAALDADPNWSAISGFIAGGINASHFQAAADLIEKHGLPIDGLNAASNYTAAKFAFVAIVMGGLQNGATGVSNAAFSAAFGAFVGTLAGPAAGQVAGTAYGYLLDKISEKVHEYDLGGKIYDFQEMLNDPEFWAIVDQYAADLFEPLLGPLDALGHWIGQNLPTPYEMSEWINDLFTDARSWVRRDPLVIDLDGDGIELVGADGSVLFDHDGDGNTSGTGWVRPDDGLLVLDRNGNGLIDNGTELFGVDTVLSDGNKATDGFAALRDLDSNSDGVFDANDEQYANVQVWRDLDQDGVSDAGELSSLVDLGIASINLNPTVRTRNYGNGNVQTAESTYTRTDGTTRTIANLDLADNPFYRTFADPIPLTPTAQVLPEMRGAGSVRDLREAASVSGDLAAALTSYANQTTRDAQQAQLDGILHAWGDTSGMPTSIEQAEAQGYILIYLIPGMNASSYDPFLLISQ